MQGSVRVAQTLPATSGLTWGSHSNNHFDVSLAMFTHVAGGGARRDHGNRHALDLAGRAERLTRKPFAIQGRQVAVPNRPGLGIEIDLARVEQAHALYQLLGTARATTRWPCAIWSLAGPTTRAAELRPCRARWHESRVAVSLFGHVEPFVLRREFALNLL